MPGMVYAWKPHTSRPDLTAQAVGEELTRIYNAQGHFFSPAAVVHHARAPDNPLHPAFQWDDQRAAVSYREVQARELIRSVVVVNEAHPEAAPVRAFVSVRIGQDNEAASRFTTMAHAMSDKDLREQVLGQALADFRAFERKYAAVLDLAGTSAAFDRARIKAAGKPDRLAG